MKPGVRVAVASLVASLIVAGTETVVAYDGPSGAASLFFRWAFAAYVPLFLVLAAIAQRASPLRGLNLWFPLLAGLVRVVTVARPEAWGAGLAMLVLALILVRSLDRGDRTPPFLFGVTVGLVLPILSARLAARYFGSDPIAREHVLAFGACAGVGAFLILRALVTRWPRVAPVFLLGPVVSLVVWSRANSGDGGAYSGEVPANALAAPSANDTRPDIALVVLDTVRSREIPGVGDLSRTMPRLEAFALTSTRFTNAWSNASWTLPAHASLFSGLNVTRHRYDSGFAVGERVPSRAFLAPRLRAAGYATAAVAANFGVFGREAPLLDGFESVRSEPLRPFQFRPWLFGLIARFPLAPWSEIFPGPSVRAPAIVDQALAQWRRAGGRPRFLFVNLMEAHLPWVPELEDRGRFGAPGLFTEREQVEALGTFLKGGRPTPAQATGLRARYAESLHSLDRSVERLLQGLVAGSRDRDLVLVVTSDHGESLGEQDRFGHRNSLDEVATRIPLIVRSRALAPGTNDAPVALVDVFRLVADAAGLGLEPGLDAEAPGVRREVILEHRPGPQAALPSSYPRGDLSALVVWPYKYREGPGDAPALFDLVSDPGESVNLVARDPDLAGFLRGRLRSLSTRASTPEPGRDPSADERLRALGYIR